MFNSLGLNNFPISCWCCKLKSNLGRLCKPKRCAKAHKRGCTAASRRAAEPARVSGSTTCSSTDTNAKAHKRGDTAASGRAAEPARVSGSTTCSSADTNAKAHKRGGTAAPGRAAEPARVSGSTTCSSADTNAKAHKRGGTAASRRAAEPARVLVLQPSEMQQCRPVYMPWHLCQHCYMW